MSYKKYFMDMAIDLSASCVDINTGTATVYTPFGAVVVVDNEVVGVGKSTVVADCDTTAHAEINAIRAANKTVGSHLFTGAELYCSGYPCPLCLSAARWANIDTIYYAAPLTVSESVGFEDAQFYRDLIVGVDNIPELTIERVDSGSVERASNVLRAWGDIVSGKWVYESDVVFC